MTTKMTMTTTKNCNDNNKDNNNNKIWKPQQKWQQPLPIAPIHVQGPYTNLHTESWHYEAGIDVENAAQWMASHNRLDERQQKPIIMW